MTTTPRLASGPSEFFFAPADSSSALKALTMHVLGIDVHVDTDDERVTAELESIIGSTPSPVSLAPREVRFRVLAGSDDDPQGVLSADDGIEDPAAFLAAFSSPTTPFTAVQTPDGRRGVCLGGDPEPLFVFQGSSGTFRKVPRWRRIIANFVLLRVLRLRSELLFFHAAAVAIGGRGVMIIGPKGSGKSTTSLALASRGHQLLGDETAAYDPANGTLLPFCRPVGIKPGPKASAIASALAQRGARPDEDGMIRIPVTELLPVAAPQPATLSAVLFLQPFAPAPALARVEAGREEVGSMQPIASSLVNVPAPARVFQMVRLLSATTCYHLHAGPPDATADMIERTILAQR